MKKPGAEVATLTPDILGWRIRFSGGPGQAVKTLEEALAEIPAQYEIHLALPGDLVLLERLTLPSIDRGELAGMVLLQLEKTLPYSIEEATSDFEIIRQSESESTLLSMAVNVAQVEALCEPLKRGGRLPQKITFFAMHVAAACPPAEVVLCLWAEGDRLEVAICENGKLGFAQNLSAHSAELLKAELPQILLSAEMEGVSTDLARVWIEQGSPELRDAVAENVTAPIELVSFDLPVPETLRSLSPAAWQAELHRAQKAGRLRQQLQVVAVVYLLALAGAFVFLAWTKGRVQKLDKLLADAKPQVEAVQSQQARWKTIAPAIDPSRFPIEILYLLSTSLPSPEVKITTFESKLSEFRVEGEAPSASLAIEFFEKLRAERALEAFEITSPPPKILSNGSAHYSIIGKL